MSTSTRSLALVLASCAAICLPLGPARAQGSGSVFELMRAEGRLAVGEETSGTLSTADVRSSDDSFLEAWALEGRVGESVTVDLISDDFDAYLYVVGPGLAGTLYDDDSGGACHARITITFLENGEHRVVASTTMPGETGTYVLRISESPGPVAEYECGEINPAVLTELPTDGRSLTLGDVKSGALTADSPLITEGMRGQAWSVAGRVGESVVITLESSAFDAYLYFTGPGLEGVMTDDDGGGDLNSLIQVTFPADGNYTAVASALAGSGFGAYTIRLEEPPDLSTLDTAGRVAEVGGTMTGQLTTDDPIVIDGRRGQAWLLEGRAGERLTIDLISDDFDAFLYFSGPAIAAPIFDDDGAGDLNSRLVVTLPEDGAYRIIVSGISADATGGYELQVTREWR